MYDETNMSLACSIPRCVCPRAALFQAMTPKHMPNPRRNTVTITVTALNSRLHMPHGHRPSPPSITKAEAAPPRNPSPHSQEPSQRASEPNQRHRHPGVSSFTMISHHRPLTRGSRQTRILENARPSGERNERGFPSRLRNSSEERLESGCLRMTALRNGYWLVNGDGLGGDRAIGTGRACL